MYRVFFIHFPLEVHFLISADFSAFILDQIPASFIYLLNTFTSVIWDVFSRETIVTVTDTELYSVFKCAISSPAYRTKRNAYFFHI